MSYSTELIVNIQRIKINNIVEFGCLPDYTLLFLLENYQIGQTVYSIKLEETKFCL